MTFFRSVILAFLCVSSPAFAATGDLLWKTRVSGNYLASSPAIAPGGEIYFGSSDGNLYVSDSHGTVRQVFHTGGAVDDSPAVGPDGTIYFGSFDTFFYALYPDGSLKWKYKTDDLIRCTPAIGVDNVIYAGSYDSYFYALNPDGTLKWRYKTGSGIASSPAIGVDGTVCFGSRDGYIYALNPDGTLKWRYRTGKEIHWSSAALDRDGTIYIGSNDGFVYALHADGSLKWKLSTGASIGSAPAIGADGVIYAESCDSFLYAVNGNGTLRWKFDLGNTKFGCHPVIDTEGIVYLGSTDGYFYALNPDGSLKWKYLTGGQFWTTGATIDDRGYLYCVSSDGFIHCLDSGTGRGIGDTPWPKFHGNLRNTGVYESFLITPSHLIITNIIPGQTGEGILTVINHGDSTLTAECISTTDSVFTVQPSVVTVAPHSIAEITVTFTPHDTRGHIAELSLNIDGRTVRIFLSGNPPSEPIPVNLRIRTTDKTTGEPLPCRIFLTDLQGRSILPGQLAPIGARMFFISSGDTLFRVYHGEYTLSIGRGNEYIPVLDEQITVPPVDTTIVVERSLERWIYMKELGWYSCDNQVNNYDNRTPRQLYPYQLAEDLNILHLICLGEGNTTQNYHYFQKGIFDFSRPFYPMVIGEEWRSRTWQNHMVLMNHSRPVSVWGNGYYDYTVTPYPYSFPPALDICDEVRAMGGIVTATHPYWYEPFTGMDNVYVNRNLAFETPADAALGKLDGMQIYMYWGYDEWNRWVWYRLLNCGFRLAPFAGTDALLNKLDATRSVMDPLAGRVRSYAYVSNQTERLDYDAWIEASKEGRSFVSSGAVLFFTVNNQLPGSEICLDAPDGRTKVTVKADARWIGGLEKIFIIVNGKTAAERSISGSQSEVTIEVELTASSWIACRVEGKTFDQFQGDAHSAPVYVLLNQKPIQSPEDARYFVGYIDKHIALLDSANHFANKEQKEYTFTRYREAQEIYRKLAGVNPLAAGEAKPETFELLPASPNPFNASTVIQYRIPYSCRVMLAVYDILGRRIAILENETKKAGSFRILWDGKDKNGVQMGSGVYIIRLQTDNTGIYRKIALVR
jgi:outer membrane protein assembly factor BamB